MYFGSMKCPKCGMTQMASSSCKSCGAETGYASAPKPRRQPQSAPAPAVVETPVAAQPEPIVEQIGIAEDPVEAQFSPPQEAAVVQAVSHKSEAEMDQIRQPFFCGTGGSLFGIQVVNAFLIVLTLGIYYFWGKVKVRNYLMSQSEFEGDRFAYHGTGKELFIGFLKAALVLGVFSGIVNAVPYLPGGTPVKIVVVASAYLAILMFVPLAIVGARRYRLSRTSWRGIRFSFRGRVGDFIKLFAKGTVLGILTLGLYYPVFIVRKYEFLTSHSYFGNQKFDFDGQGRDLLGMYLLASLLFIPTLGLYSFWFMAQKHRYLWEHTYFGTARFNSTVTGGRLLLLKLGNLFLILFTLGLAWPWVMVRNLRFYFTYLTLEGPLDLAAIEQDARAASPTGEGLDALMDLDTGFSAA